MQRWTRSRIVSYLKRWPIEVAIIASYLVVGLALVPLYRHQINPDGVSYILIARDYLHGQLAAAINAYWSPLFSWLLAPFLVFGLDGLLAARLLNVIVGVGLLIVSWRLMNWYSVARAITRLLLVALAVMTLSWALAGPITPDLLVATLLGWYFLSVLRYLKYSRPPALALAGAIGGVAFLAKTYALPFVGLHLVVVVAYQWLMRRHALRPLGRSLAAGLLGLMAVCLPWVVVISLAHHHPTIGTSGAYNLALAGPTHPTHPMLTDGLIAPPHPNGISSWDDPSRFQLPSWFHIWPPRHWRYAASLMIHSLPALGTLLITLSSLTLGFLVTAFLLATRWRQTNHDVVIGLATIVLYLAGYSLVYVESRYIWFVALLVVVIIGSVLTSYSDLPGARPLGLMVALALTVVTLCWHPIHDLRSPRSVNDNLYHAASDARFQSALTGQRVASDADWISSLYVSYFAGAHYYGLLQPYIQTNQLAQYHIHLLLHWSHTPNAPAIIPGSRLLYSDSTTGLQLYAVP